MMQENQALQDARSAKDTNPANRRQYERVVCQVDVTLESETTFYQGFTENISEGGLFIATYNLRELGQQISLEFTLPGRAEPIHVEGEVRWLREYNEMTPDIIPGIGVRFINMSPEQARAITDFVRQKEPLFYDDDDL